MKPIQDHKAVVVNSVAAPETCSHYDVETRFWSRILETMHWGYLVPAGVAFLGGMYLASDVEVSRAENCTTSKLRLMILIFGLIFVYLGILAWTFDLNVSRYQLRPSKLHSAVFIVVGIVFVILAALRSRASLIKDSDYFTKPPGDIEINARPNISPADRVKKNRETAHSKRKSGI